MRAECEKMLDEWQWRRHGNGTASTTLPLAFAALSHANSRMDNRLHDEAM